MKAFEKILNEIEILKLPFPDECPSYQGDTNTLLDMIKEIVQKVAAEYNNGWISCSERLPQKMKQCQTEEYAVTMRFVKGNQKGIPFTSHVNFDYESKEWMIKDYEIIAWQPLPEPYQPK